MWKVCHPLPNHFSSRFPPDIEEIEIANAERCVYGNKTSRHLHGTISRYYPITARISSACPSTAVILGENGSGINPSRRGVILSHYKPGVNRAYDPQMARIDMFDSKSISYSHYCTHGLCLRMVFIARRLTAPFLFPPSSACVELHRGLKPWNKSKQVKSCLPYILLFWPKI